jgi:hypothetical protein
MTLYPRVRVGNATVYVSGTVICRPGQTIEITPLPAPTGAFRIELVFIDNALLPSGSRAENKPNNLVTVTLTNFGPNTTSTRVAISIGTLASQSLLLDVAASQTGAGAEAVRIVTYTVLQGPP